MLRMHSEVDNEMCGMICLRVMRACGLRECIQTHALGYTVLASHSVLFIAYCYSAKLPHSGIPRGS